MEFPEDAGYLTDEEKKERENKIFLEDFGLE